MIGSTLLVIDDTQEDRDALQNLLCKSFKVLVAKSGKEALEMAKTLRPDAALIDVMMPEMDGISVCKLIRNEPGLKTMPVMMLSAYGDETSRTESFLWGADDFVAKPYSGRELIARILAKLNWVRQPKSEANTSVLACGNLHMDEVRLEVKIDEKKVGLTVFEFTLLKYLVENSNRVLSREKILKDIWNGQIVTQRTVDTHIYAIRKKLLGANVEIGTIHGAGYILKAL